MERGLRFIGTPCFDMALYNDLSEVFNIFLNRHPEINTGERSHGQEPNALSFAVKLGAKKYVKILGVLASPNILLFGISSVIQSWTLFSFKILFNMTKSANSFDPFILFVVTEKSTWEPRPDRVKKQIVYHSTSKTLSGKSHQPKRKNALHHVVDLGRLLSDVFKQEIGHWLKTQYEKKIYCIFLEAKIV